MVAAGEAPDDEASSVDEQDVGAISGGAESGGADRGMAVGENRELLLLSRLLPLPVKPAVAMLLC